MKKIFILALLTISVTAYTRDYEYNERRDIQMRKSVEGIDKSGRSNCEIWNETTGLDTDLQIELMNQSRGHEDR